MRTCRMKNVWSSPAWRAVYPKGFSEIMNLHHIWILCAVIFLHLCIFVFLWSVSSFFFVLYAVYDSWILMPPCNCCQEVIIALLHLITFDKIPIISLSFTCFRVNIQWKWKMLDIEQWTMTKKSIPYSWLSHQKHQTIPKLFYSMCSKKRQYSQQQSVSTH